MHIGTIWNEILTGTVVRFGTKYAGLGKIETANPDNFEIIKAKPGVMTVSAAKLQSELGYYMPYNLFYAGQRPGVLDSCPPDQQATTPFGLALMDHQRRSVGLCRLVCRESAGILVGADIGSGKSIVALQSMWLDGFLAKSGVIIGPLAARDTWCGEDSDARKHYGLHVHPVSGTVALPKYFEPGRWYFCHYDILGYWHSTIFRDLKPESMIVDESQDLCNPRSDRHKSAKSLSMCSCIKRRILLSGSPIPKNRLDLYGQMAIAQPLQWGSWVDFGVAYCNGHKESHTEEGEGHWVFDGRTGTEELQARLAGGYLRYTKDQIAEDLPKLERHRIDIELDSESKDAYHLALTDIRKYRETLEHGAPLPSKISFGGVAFTVPKSKPPAAELLVTSALKSILDAGKLPHAKRVIEDLLAAGHRKIVVGTWRRESAKILLNSLTNGPGALKIRVFGPVTGNMEWGKRLDLAQQFARESGAAVYVATRGSVKYSINALSAADACLQITPDWNPDSNLQFEGRMHRKGNPNALVHSYYMLSPDTLDDRILELLRDKGREAVEISSADTEGAHLAADLNPTGFSGESWSMDDIMSFLPEVETF